jgi:hypothetical protein
VENIMQMISTYNKIRVIRKFTKFCLFYFYNFLRRNIFTYLNVLTSLLVTEEFPFAMERIHTQARKSHNHYGQQYNQQ